jgi:hypothetical protein
MKTMRLRHPLGALGLVTTIALSAPSQAALDGKTDLICSVTDVIGCPDAGACVQGQARNFDLPQFIAVDFATKQVRATNEGGEKIVSPFTDHQETRNQLIMQSVENGHGWTVSIDRRDGRMTTSTTGEDVSYILFGACIAP